MTLFLMLLMIFFGFPGRDQSLPQKIKIVTTVFPLMEFAKAVCGKRSEVYLLLPPGAEVHTWKPRPSDIIKLSTADVFIYIGANLEPWAHDLLESVRGERLRILEMSQGLPNLKGRKPAEHEGEAHEASPMERHGEHQDHEDLDPHIWLDFEIDQVIVDRIAACISEVMPDQAAEFKLNAERCKQKLQKLHEEYKAGLKNCQNRTLILGGHAAFGYLARQYDLHQVSLYGLSPDSKPTPRTLVEVVEMAKSHSVECIFFETAVSNDLARVLAKEIGARTLVLNPGATLSREELDSGMSFFDIMEKNLENLRYGLGCR